MFSEAVVTDGNFFTGLLVVLGLALLVYLIKGSAEAISHLYNGKDIPGWTIIPAIVFGCVAAIVVIATIYFGLSGIGYLVNALT